VPSNNSKNPKQRRLASIDVAAEYAGVSRRTICRRIDDGTIPAYKFGPRAVRVDLDELDAAMRPIPTAGSAA